MSQPQRRTLNDLYVLGQTVRIDETDPNADPDDATQPHDGVIVWMQKLDPVDHDSAVRKAKAARARKRAALNDPDSEEYLELLDTIASVSRQALIEQVTAPDEAKLVESATSEMLLGEDSEWAKDGYIDGLYASWSETLQARYIDDPDDPEALRVLSEFTRYDIDLRAALDPQIKDLRAQYEQAPDEDLRAKALEALTERHLQESWLEEFVRCEVWLATRKPCAKCLEEGDADPPIPHGQGHQALHADYYFQNREAVDRLHPSVRNHLEAAYLTLSVDPTEGKGSPGTGATSGSSESPEPEETAPSSGQPAAAV